MTAIRSFPRDGLRSPPQRHEIPVVEAMRVVNDETGGRDRVLGSFIRLWESQPGS
jgi:hypothetical protein